MTSDGQPAEILLTGGTGFIGAFLLRRLLDKTTARVHCLARGGTTQAVTERLHAAQSAYSLGRLDESRVVPVPGDLAAPGLGLAADLFGALAHRVSTVIHAGAQVNLVQPAPVLEAVNVAGTAEIVRLAAERGAAVHLVSTSEVFGPGDGAVDEDTVPEDRFPPASGYGQTKRAAELLVLRARRDGLPVTVTRLDRVVGDSLTGACQAGGDDFWLLVRSALTTGVLPDAPVNVTPVDFAADAVLCLAAAPETSASIAHVCHPQPIRMADLAAALGRPIRVLPHDEWAATLRRLGEHPDCDPLLRLLPLIAERVLGGRPRFEAPRTTAVLRKLGLRHPPVNVPLLGMYVRHLRSTGFLPAIRHDQPLITDIRG
ncbi:thioester reductase domain-containing protein [Nonomuraea purpurea]|uniref:Thioester reductase domain-containing protein n=1 Tax=Nonomuraea purpurea TaxID=1849276 RepID=A0ABV8GIV0_9ACTN